jgi:peptidoglycan/xylan/chitin deacetylase (PgdA/CDA1 family)
LKVITLDTDWAPDFILEHVSEILTERKIKATWFITNESLLQMNRRF